MAKKKEKEIVDISSLTPEEKRKRIEAAMDVLREYSPMVSFLDEQCLTLRALKILDVIF